eukprot:GGOE01011256.1.p3 GENE.GGOE01011256.1~~GGOE01011256.1.p3  ORF type:complete len:110 (-),score=7.14 GGOE01011256.1:525-854(-)
MRCNQPPPQRSLQYCSRGQYRPAGTSMSRMAPSGFVSAWMGCSSGPFPVGFPNCLTMAVLFTGIYDGMLCSYFFLCIPPAPPQQCNQLLCSIPDARLGANETYFESFWS